MVNVDIDRELYLKIKKSVKANRYSYPSIKFFVQKAIYNELVSSNSNVDKFYSQIKDILKDDPQLLQQIEFAHDSKIKSLRKVRR